MEEFEKPEKTEKEKAWEEMASRVELIADKLGKEIDPGIKEAIIAFNLLDINTTGSCEGHLDRGTFAPYIDVKAKGVDELEQEVQRLRAEGVEFEDKRILSLVEEVERKNFEERKKLFPYFDEFYKERKVPFQQQLIIHGLGWGRSRIESQGAEIQEIETGELRGKRLGEYQEEMREFTDFLKKKYFE